MHPAAALLSQQRRSLLARNEEEKRTGDAQASVARRVYWRHNESDEVRAWNEVAPGLRTRSRRQPHRRLIRSRHGYPCSRLDHGDASSRCRQPERGRHLPRLPRIHRGRYGRRLGELRDEARQDDSRICAQVRTAMLRVSHRVAGAQQLRAAVPRQRLSDQKREGFADSPEQRLHPDHDSRDAAIPRGARDQAAGRCDAR